MKKTIILVFICFFAIFGCKNNAVSEPKILIERATMIDIIYDLSVLEAMRSMNSAGTIVYPKANAYIKKNYKIDSLTFAQNSKYYASDPKDYKKMYDEVKERLEVQATKLNGGKKPVETSGALKN